MRQLQRRYWLLAVAALMVAAGAALAGPAVAAAGPFCGQVWGSGAKQAAGAAASLSAVRAGETPCYDRMVIDLSGPAGYHVEYVSSVLTQGQGAPLSLRGGAFLNVTVMAATNDAQGRPTFSPADRANVVNVAGYQTFRQVAFGGSFEGYTTFGLGVRARLPFRVFLLAGPGVSSRLVVDVGHQW